MKKLVILEEGDFVLSLPKIGKTVVVQNNNLYISEDSNYPGEIMGAIEKEGYK